jgi:CRP-like cAMP-binding protein
MRLDQSQIHNSLLRTMGTDDFYILSTWLEAIDLPRRFVLSPSNRPSDHTYFLESGIASVVVDAGNGMAAEVSLVGREGLVPVTGVLGPMSSPFDVFMQVGGHGFRIATIHLLAACEASLSLRALLNRYFQATLVQTSYTAFSNANHQIEQRLARWILMCLDRTQGDSVTLTHEFLSVMLAVRRQSVTTTLHSLEGKRLITSSRGSVTVRDRKGLEALAGSAYGVPEREYQDLIRPPT